MAAVIANMAGFVVGWFVGQYVVVPWLRRKFNGDR